MEKIYKKTSLFSHVVNTFVFFSKDKKNSSTVKDAKKFVKKYSKRNSYKLPDRLRMKREGFKKMPIYSYNGSMEKKKKRKIIYVHGGTFVEEAKYFQIKFAMNIAMKTNASLIFPVYPLIPNCNCMKLHSLMEELYDAVIDTTDELILLGDSAGGGFILSFAMYLRDHNKKIPKHVVMLSPWLDLSLSNPDVYKNEKKDYMCGIDGTRYVGKLWADQLDIRDSLASPIYGSLLNLPEMTIITGENEILNCDCHELSEKLAKLTIKHNFIEYKNQGHDFGAYPTKEGKMVIDDIANIINGIEVK